jgi:hypothetical protein
MGKVKRERVKLHNPAQRSKSVDAESMQSQVSFFTCNCAKNVCLGSGCMINILRLEVYKLSSYVCCSLFLVFLDCKQHQDLVD